MQVLFVDLEEGCFKNSAVMTGWWAGEGFPPLSPCDEGDAVSIRAFPTRFSLEAAWLFPGQPPLYWPACGTSSRCRWWAGCLSPYRTAPQTLLHAPFGPPETGWSGGAWLEGTGEKVSEEEGASDLPISCDTAVHIGLLLLSGASRVRLRAVVTASEHLSWWIC